MIVAVTGHRPNKLYGYDLKDERYTKLVRVLQKVLTQLNAKTAISGMAIGVDQLFAIAVLDLNIGISENEKIHLHAALPCLDQEIKWPKESIELYNTLLDKCDSKKIVVETMYNNYCMQARNKYMVDKCDVLIAIWDGSPGGTGNCVDYAMRVKRKTVFINPNTLELRVEKYKS